VSLLMGTYPAAAARRTGTGRWADMPTPLGAWVLVNAKALGPQESRRFVRQRYHPFSWPNLDTPHASQLLSCRMCPSLWRWGISPPSQQMSRLLVMSMEPCAAWRLRRFERLFAAKDLLSMSCVNAACSSPKIPNPPKPESRKCIIWVPFNAIKKTEPFSAT
jgi:hypothetical protein